MDMVAKRIAIRTDASSEIGTGHFMRCLTLADALKKNGALVSFVVRNLPPYLAQMLQERNMACHALPEVVNANVIDELPHSQWLKAGQHQDAEQTLQVLAKHEFDWVIVDHYAIDCRWESMLRGIAKKIMVIDDLADRQHDCDLLLDQNYYHDMDARYVGKVPQHCKLLLGPSYALLRDEFREMRASAKPRDGTVNRVMVFFGGMDATNITELVIQVLESMKLPISVDVVVGLQHPNLNSVINSCEENDFACHVQTSQMAKIMSDADLAISAGGSANWEKCCMGLPSIVIATAQNQVKLSKELSCLNVCEYLGEVENISKISIMDSLFELFNAPDKLIHFSENGLRLVDGCGASKVIESMGL